jgi:hypothetical protein
VVALGELGSDELVEDLGGFGEAHRVGGLGAVVQCLAPSAVCEGHDVAFAAGLDGGVIFLVGVAFAEMERGGLEGGDGGCHVVVWLGVGGWFVVGG